MANLLECQLGTGITRFLDGCLGISLRLEGAIKKGISPAIWKGRRWPLPWVARFIICVVIFCQFYNFMDLVKITKASAILVPVPELSLSPSWISLTRGDPACHERRIRGADSPSSAKLETVTWSEIATTQFYLLDEDYEVATPPTPHSTPAPSITRGPSFVRQRRFAVYCPRLKMKRFCDVIAIIFRARSRMRLGYAITVLPSSTYLAIWGLIYLRWCLSGRPLILGRISPMDTGSLPRSDLNSEETAPMAPAIIRHVVEEAPSLRWAAELEVAIHVAVNNGVLLMGNAALVEKHWPLTCRPTAPRVWRQAVSVTQFSICPTPSISRPHGASFQPPCYIR